MYKFFTPIFLLVFTFSGASHLGETIWEIEEQCFGVCSPMRIACSRQKQAVEQRGHISRAGAFSLGSLGSIFKICGAQSLVNDNSCLITLHTQLVI